jgi:hypothetical protein
MKRCPFQVTASRKCSRKLPCILHASELRPRPKHKPKFLPGPSWHNLRGNPPGPVRVIWKRLEK